MSSPILTRVILFMLVAAILLASPRELQAQVCIPEGFQGTVQTNHSPAVDGLLVSARISGTEYGNGTTSNGGYSLTVACPPGFTGTVFFFVSGNQADQTAPWTQGAITQLNLTVSIPDYTVSLLPQTVTVPQGHRANYTVTVTSIAPFNSPVNLTASTLPANTTYVLQPTPVTPPAGGTVHSWLNITTNYPNTPVGTFTIHVQGQSGSIIKPSQADLVVSSARISGFTLSARPTTNSGPEGGQTVYTVNITSVSGFSSAVFLTLTGASGISSQFSPNPVIPSPNTSVLSTMTLVIGSTTPLATYNITIVASSTSELHTTSVLLTVSPPVPVFPAPFTLLTLLLILSLPTYALRRRRK